MPKTAKKKRYTKPKPDAASTFQMELPTSREPAVLRAHFMEINDTLACVAYDRRVAMCQGCLREGANTLDKQYGHARFCSQACWDARLAYEGTFPKPAPDPEAAKRKSKKKAERPAPDPSEDDE